MTKAKVNDLLIENINSWGAVEYNIPLRTSYTETRSSANVAHRHIPQAVHYVDCRVMDPLPERVIGRDMAVAAETYRTTSGDYSSKIINPNKATERHDCSINCRRVIYVKDVDKKLQQRDICQPSVVLSEMKDNFHGGLQASSTTIDAPNTKVIASSKNEAAFIPETSKGFMRLLDPYVSTYRSYHTPFSATDQFKSKDQITVYSESNLPRSKGFGPKFQPIWDPLLAKPHRLVFDKVKLKKEYHEVPTCHNPVSWLKKSFDTESRSNYLDPYARSALATWRHGVRSSAPPYPPNPYQTNAAPAMYCTDYCHISQGTSTRSVVDQVDRARSR
ncbi:hypothetical protein EVAR_81533_1 [Eumeta japonica]|uniref:Uncharacterized protein n=1 Tax=Eumeta variegata TaxID=151549 RepID=A0A4C1UZ70_EUMVA|nr:hypothetical protein EVAR_81533_1 [Eumeta japonica]